MEKVMKYKGVVLRENTTSGNLAGEGAYAVLLANGSRIPFKSKKDFKDAVNGINPYAPVPYGINRIDTNNDWKDACRVEDFREYALENQFSDGIHFKAPEDCELFSIIEEDGKKYIHVHGFVWDASGERDWEDEYDDEDDEECVRTNEKDGYWVITEYSGYILPIEKFIEKKKNPDYAFEVGTRYQQYEDDCTAKEMVEILNTYFNGHGANARLSYKDVTLDTPCGDYIG